MLRRKRMVTLRPARSAVASISNHCSIKLESETIARARPQRARRRSEVIARALGDVLIEQCLLGRRTLADGTRVYGRGARARTSSETIRSRSSARIDATRATPAAGERERNG